MTTPEDPTLNDVPQVPNETAPESTEPIEAFKQKLGELFHKCEELINRHYHDEDEKGYSFARELSELTAQINKLLEDYFAKNQNLEEIYDIFFTQFKRLNEAVVIDDQASHLDVNATNIRLYDLFSSALQSLLNLISSKNRDYTKVTPPKPTNLTVGTQVKLGRLKDAIHEFWGETYIKYLSPKEQLVYQQRIQILLDQAALALASELTNQDAFISEKDELFWLGREEKQKFISLQLILKTLIRVAELTYSKKDDIKTDFEILKTRVKQILETTKSS